MINSEMVGRLSKGLSFTELQIARVIFDEIGDADEYVKIHAGNLSKQWGLYRSQFGDALRIMEVGGIVTHRSRGCKGLMVKIIDRDTYEELVKGVIV